jgi:hypothetical protein
MLKVDVEVEVKVEVEVLMLCWAGLCGAMIVIRCCVQNPDLISAAAVGSVVATRKQNRDNSRVE